MTVYCERDTAREGNHCIKCGGEWVAGTPLPACGQMNGFTPATEPSNIIATDPAIMPLPSDPDTIVRMALALQSGEPFFILRASDLLADYLVEQWARNAEANGCDPKRVRAAREKAQEMRTFKPRAYPA